MFCILSSWFARQAAERGGLLATGLGRLVALDKSELTSYNKTMDIPQFLTNDSCHVSELCMYCRRFTLPFTAWQKCDGRRQRSERRGRWMCRPVGTEPCRVESGKTEYYS